MGLVTQQDPIGIAGGFNLYGYANGDPVNFSDPFGLCVEEEREEREETTDCERFARNLERIASETETVEDFVREVGKIHAGFPDGRMTLHPDPVNPAFRGESGFRSGFTDGDQHPARHFSAYVVAGHDVGPFGHGIALAREIPFVGAARSLPDVWLGDMGVILGRLLRSGAISPSQAGQWVRDHL